jgi:hypothetical protein
LGEANAAMRELRGQLHALDAGALSERATHSLASMDQTLAHVDQVLSRLEGDKGLLQGAERVTNSLNEVARGAQSVGPELELTLREVRGAARSVHHFMDALQRDPDMLLKGKAEARR